MPLAPVSATAFDGPRAAFSAAEREITYLPEFDYWDGVSQTAAGCPIGGGFIRMRSAGDRARFVLRSCGFSRGFVMTGRGSYGYSSDRFVLNVKVEGRFAGRYRFVRAGSSVTLERVR